VLSIKIGPLIVTPFVLTLVIAFFAALLVGWLVGRKTKTAVEPIISNMLIWGVLTARVAFVALYIGDYIHQPWRIIDIRDGGFMREAGVVAAIIVGIYYFWRTPPLRKVLGSALATGLLIWVVGTGLFKILQPVPPNISELPLLTLTGEPQNFGGHGKPIVANLWATWCPPCRREMPVLASAQQSETQIDFILVNQGESADEILGYLNEQSFTLDHIYLDKSGVWADRLGAAGMPTTLFFDAEGNLVGAHTGELSQESLQHALKRYFR
jgi:Prolipoprotein diacylglyceryltransferase